MNPAGGFENRWPKPAHFSRFPGHTLAARSPRIAKPFFEVNVLNIERSAGIYFLQCASVARSGKATLNAPYSLNPAGVSPLPTQRRAGFNKTQPTAGGFKTVR
jgi:hypothetical protein